nr:hypothetical protein [Streptomyces sp. GC420]
MSFDEEWAALKAEALARQSTAMRLNQVADPGGGGRPGPGGAPGGGLEYNTDSINGNANLLVEIAGFLYEGRPDGDLCTTARVPRAHSDVAAQVNRFSRFADDQFQDAVALFAALSTKLRTAGSDLVKVDGGEARRYLDVVLEGEYVSPEAR